MSWASWLGVVLAVLALIVIAAALWVGVVLEIRDWIREGR